MIVLSKYEVIMLSSLAYGATVSEIRKILRHYRLKPNSESAVDKNLRALRKKLNCRTNPQMVYKYRELVIYIDLEESLK